jgi:hypothetical protein
VDFTPPTSDLPRGLAISPPVYFDEDPGPEEIRHWVEAARLTLITLGSQNALGTRYCLTSSRCLLYLKKATRVVQIRPMRGREAGFLRVPHWWCTTPTPVTKSVSTCASWSFSGELHWHPMVADIQTPNQNALNKAPFSTQRNATPPNENQT